MFSNIGWSEMVILLVAALVILGPERLPGAVRWTTRTLRQVRDYASGATTQLRDELGPEFDEIRKPLSELNELRKPLNHLRSMSPRQIVTTHLLDGDDSIFTGNFDKLANFDIPSTYPDVFSMPTPGKPLARNEKPPIDTDAT